MVPVLSSRMTSTSPDASTARPLIASTLNRATRSMPAMPMADSRPPMVVGIRHTSSATRATVSTVVPAYSPKGRSVTVAMRNTIVRPGEQDRERDLVRGPLAFRALDEGDHPVQEGLARVGRHADHQPVADQRRATGHRAPDVGAGLLEHGRGLTGDRGLVDEADALDDVAVAADDLAGLDDDHVAAPELGRAHGLARPVLTAAPGDRLRSRPAERRGLGAATRLRDGLGIGREQDREPEPDRDLELEPGTRPAGHRLPRR